MHCWPIPQYHLLQYKLPLSPTVLFYFLLFVLWICNLLSVCLFKGKFDKHFDRSTSFLPLVLVLVGEGFINNLPLINLWKIYWQLLDFIVKNISAVCKFPSCFPVRDNNTFAFTHSLLLLNFYRKVELGFIFFFYLLFVTVMLLLDNNQYSVCLFYYQMTQNQYYIFIASYQKVSWVKEPSFVFLFSCDGWIDWGLLLINCNLHRCTQRYEL